MRKVILLLFLLVLAVVVFGKVKQPESLPPITLPQPVLEPKSSPKALLPKVMHDVPFVSQAPTGNWADPRQQDGCEEAASYMAYLWATGKSAPASLAEQEKALLAVSDWEEQTYSVYHDTSAADTAERILKGYFKYDNYEVKYGVTAESIRQELSEGDLVIAPADGQAIGNPYFTAPGPERHFLAIIGYDLKTDEFITNDNGTRRGKSYRYKTAQLINSLRDYPTGDHVPITENRKAMIAVSK